MFQDTIVNSHGESIRLIAYESSTIKKIVIYFLYLLTGGFLRLVFFWKPEWMLYCTHRKSDIDDADSMLLFDQYNQAFVERVENKYGADLLYPLGGGSFREVNHLRYFDNRKSRYIWDDGEKKFVQLTGLDFQGISLQNIGVCGGLTVEEQNRRRSLFGQNLIEIAVKPLVTIFVTEVLNPFYIYQFLACGFWAISDYYYYSGYILVMSIFSLGITTYQIRVNQTRLRDKVFGFDTVSVVRENSQTETIQSSELVPGDIVLVDKENCQLYCDLALLAGEVIVNESLLTGESHPVTKTAIRPSKDAFDSKRDSKNILFCGTTIIQVRRVGEEQPRAVVMRTNFSTVKGELVKSILFPKPIDFKFNRHINHFLLGMAGIALIGFALTVVMKIQRHRPFWEIFIKSIDLITVVVPPELPAALTIAVIVVDNRLRRKKIFCMSPRAINISGCVDCVCFDKTGTLTEENIDMQEVLATSSPSVSKSVSFDGPFESFDELQDKNILRRCLATCHTLKILAGDIIGEDLELKLFKWTGWTMTEPVDSVQKFGYPVPAIISDSKTSLAVLKQFPFSSSFARMSVVVSEIHDSSLSSSFEFYMKGAPEVVVKMCDKSTVPKDFNEILEMYTKQSFRVLAIASKSFKAISAKELEERSMESYETELTFLGFTVMRNKLKPSTKTTIQTLNEAKMRSVIVTGDNLLTALSVAKECEIFDDENILMVDYDPESDQFITSIYQRALTNCTKNGEFQMSMRDGDDYKLSMTGSTFKAFADQHPELMPKLLSRCAVFARMAPEQKQLLVENLQSIGYYVAMCGDGANDCGALKVAHAGISLSDTEASVASAFTSLTGEIDCVVDLLREGRASLVSVFGIVRFMACYNITTFIAMLILYYYQSALTDFQNLYQDIFIISLYCFVFGRNQPYKKLAPIGPPTSLLGVIQFSSIILQLTLVILVQLSAVLYLHRQSWYIPNTAPVDEVEDEAALACHDNFALFIVQVFQYTVLVIIFSRGAPFREPIYKNTLLTLCMIIGTALTLFIVITPESPFHWIPKIFEFKYEHFPVLFRWKMVGFVVAQLFIALGAEKLFVEHLITKWSQKRTKLQYEKIYDSCTDLGWLLTVSNTAR